MGASASTVVYQTGFETSDNAGFVSGATIASVDSWSVLAGDAKIGTTTVQAGSQAVELAANTVIDRNISSASSVVWVQGWFRGAGSAGSPNFPASPAASAIVFFGSTDIQALNGNGSGGGTFSGTGVALSAAAFTKVALRLDYQARDYDVYVNDALELTGMGFRDNVAQLNGFQNLASEASFFDTFSVIARAQYDANGDRSINVADLVTIVNEITTPGTITNPIWRDNADGNGDNAINATDRGALVNQILGL